MGIKRTVYTTVVCDIFRKKRRYDGWEERRNV